MAIPTGIPESATAEVLRLANEAVRRGRRAAFYGTIAAGFGLAAAGAAIVSILLRACP